MKLRQSKLPFRKRNMKFGQLNKEEQKRSRLEEWSAIREAVWVRNRTAIVGDQTG